MFDTLLLRPSLHCNTPLHFTTLHQPHFTQLHFTTIIDTSLPLIYTSLPFHLASRIYISYGLDFIRPDSLRTCAISLYSYKNPASSLILNTLLVTSRAGLRRVGKKPSSSDRQAADFFTCPQLLVKRRGSHQAIRPEVRSVLPCCLLLLSARVQSDSLH